MIHSAKVIQVISGLENLFSVILLYISHTKFLEEINPHSILAPKQPHQSEQRMIMKFSQSPTSTWDSFESEKALKDHNPSHSFNLSRFSNQSLILHYIGPQNYRIQFLNQNEISSLTGVLLQHTISTKVKVYLSLL
jgi:hypothetical protein